MSEATPEPEAPAQEAEAPQDESQDSTDWKAEARKWEQRAKDNGAKAAEFDKARKASMSEAERAVAEAEARGRSAAASEFGKRLARTEFDALAGRRNAGYDTAAALEYVDLGKFVADDGEPDMKAIAAAVERLVPEASGQQGAPPVVDLDQGNRGGSAANKQGMNTFIRKAAGRA